MNSLDRDETKETVIHDTSPAKLNEFDDRLTIKIDNADHTVDTIVQFKKTPGGVP